MARRWSTMRVMRFSNPHQLPSDNVRENAARAPATLSPRPRTRVLSFVALAQVSTLALVMLGATSPAHADWTSAREAFWGQRSYAERLLKEVAQAPETDAATRRDAFHLLARNSRRLGHFGAAIDAYREAIALGVGDQAQARTALADKLAFGLLEALVAGRQAGDTFDATAEVLSLAQQIAQDPFSDHRPEAAYMAARYLESTGALSEARAAYTSARDRFPEATFIPELERRLDALSSTTVSSVADEEARLASLGVLPPPERRVPLALLWEHLRERRFDLLSEGLAPWLVEPGEGASAEEQRHFDEALELLLEDQVENYRFPEALATSERLKQRGRRGLSKPRETRVYALDGQWDKARAELGKRFGKKSRAYWEALGDLAFEFARYEEAYDAWIKARGKKAAKNPTEQMVWALLRMGKANEASRHWESAKNVRGRGVRLFDRYWLARSRQMAGRTAEARTLFTGLVGDAPLEYYGLQAASRLLEMDGTAPTDTPQPTSSVLKKGDEANTLRTTIAWSEASLKGAFDQRLEPAPLAEIAAEADRFASSWGEALPEAIRAAELIRLGDTTAAVSELRVIDMDIRASKLRGQSGMNRTRSELLDNRPTPRARAGESIRSERSRRTSEGLAQMKRRGGELREQLRRLQVLLGDAYATRRAVLENERFGPGLIDARGKELYPIAYADVVEPLAHQLGLPPYFVYAIMTVESAFHPGAVSVANAYGLVQVIPRTGDNLARELGFNDFTPERLLEPSTSIYFGGYYLARLLSRFSGQEPLAAAAYNAGPHRVSTWLMARGSIALDMFIEDIPYDQAKAYTKRIFEHVAAYRRVYHGETQSYIRNTIDTKLGEGPNY